MKAVLIGLFLAVAPWVLFNIVDAMNPHAMLVGLGLFTILVSAIGGIIIIVGLVSLFRAFAARRQAPE